MIATFYSYKGGVGRSMALANVAHWFYLRGARVLMIDWDLEAPGLEQYFYDDPRTLQEIRSRPGVIDMLKTFQRQWPALGLAVADTSDEQIREALATSVAPPDTYLCRMSESHSTNGGDLWLLTAGRRTDDDLGSYAEAVQGFDWDGFYSQYRGDVYFDWVREFVSDPGRLDLVLIDSRTGVTEMGGVCTRHMADVVVSLCAPNLGNLDGVVSMATTFEVPELAEARRGRALQSIIVPSRVENSERDARNAFMQRFVQRTDRFVPGPLRAAGGFWPLKIPYVPYYAYQEMLAIGRSGADEELAAAYGRIAAALVNLAPEGSRLRQLVAASDGGQTQLEIGLGAAEAFAEVWDGFQPPDRERLAALICRLLRIGDDGALITVQRTVVRLDHSDRALLGPLMVVGLVTLRPAAPDGREILELRAGASVERWPAIKQWLLRPGNHRVVLWRQSIRDLLQSSDAAVDAPRQLLRGAQLREAESVLASARHLLDLDEIGLIERSRRRQRSTRIATVSVITVVTATVMLATWWVLRDYFSDSHHIGRVIASAPDLLPRLDGKARGKIIGDWAKALALAGHGPEALEALNAIADPSERGLGLVALAETFWRQHQDELGDRAIQSAIRTANDASDTVRVRLLIRVAQTSLDLKKVSSAEAALAQWNPAGHRSSIPAEDVALALWTQARVFHAMSTPTNRTKAGQTADRSRLTALRVVDPDSRARLLARLAHYSQGLADARFTALLAEETITAVAGIKEVHHRARTLAEVAPLLADTGVLPDALLALDRDMAADNTHDDESEARVLVSRLHILRAIGTVEELQNESERVFLAVRAMPLAEQIELFRDAAEPLQQTWRGGVGISIAKQLALLAGRADDVSRNQPRSDKAGADGQLRELREAALAARQSAAMLFANHRRSDEALHTAESIAIRSERCMMLADIADHLLAQEAPREASQIAEELVKTYRDLPAADPSYVSASLRVHDVLLRLNRSDEARDILMSAYKLFHSVSLKDPDPRYQPAALARGLARVGEFRLARKTADRAAEENNRLRAYSAIVTEYVRYRNPSMVPERESAILNRWDTWLASSAQRVIGEGGYDVALLASHPASTLPR